jgi:NtrC-family two-component system sensor histidine kinase KinB
MSDIKFLNGAVFIPILSGDQLYAILVLGAKPHSRIYNSLDLTSLEALARVAEHTLRVILSGLSQEQRTAVWAHDLVKPFSMKGSFSLLEEMALGTFGVLSGEMSRAIELIRGDVDFVRKNLTRLIHPGQADTYDILPGAIRPVFDRVQEKFKQIASGKGIDWRVDLPPKELRVFWDWAMIEYRVLGNLLENAFRHTPPNGQVELGYKVTDQKVIVWVKDSGGGISTDDIQKLFQLRSQLDSDVGGLAGLGLFSAKMVIQAHKGQIGAESVKGSGATFHFDLPLASVSTIKPVEEK